MSSSLIWGKFPVGPMKFHSEIRKLLFSHLKPRFSSDTCFFYCVNFWEVIRGLYLKGIAFAQKWHRPRTLSTHRFIVLFHVSYFLLPEQNLWKMNRGAAGICADKWLVRLLLLEWSAQWSKIPPNPSPFPQIQTLLPPKSKPFSLPSPKSKYFSLPPNPVSQY